MNKILIVEDNLEIQTLMAYFFSKEGFNVDTASEGMEALKKLKNKHYNLIILDLMLPNINGKNIAKMIKDIPEVYGNPKIMMVTAKSEIEDVIEGLEIGADDYLKKPFDPRELVLRGRKLLNLENNFKVNDLKLNTKEIYSFLNLRIDKEKFLVTIDSIPIDFTKKEFDLLFMLVINKNIVVTRNKILNQVWETQYSIGDRTVDVHIAKLREKLGQIGECIKTIKGVGYKLEEKK